MNYTQNFIELFCITLIPGAPVKCHNSILLQASFKTPSTCILIHTGLLQMIVGVLTTCHTQHT